MPATVRHLLEIAAHLAGMPFAVAALTEADREPVGFGLSPEDCARLALQIAPAVLSGGSLVVADDETAEVGPVRFALALPLLDTSGERIGLLAVADRAARDPAALRVDLLEQIARSVVAHHALAWSDAEQAGRARLAREHQELQARLAQGQRLEALGRLAGGIAHDFNNLLAVILNFAAFVEEDLPAESTTRADVEEIRRAATRAAEITRQLLLFSRHDPALTEPVGLDDLLRDFAPLLRRSLAKNIELAIEPDLAQGHVAVNRGLLEQVLLNLVFNARDAMPDGGRLTVASGPLATDPGFACLRVIDTGAGMTAEVLARAFEPFFTTKRAGSGTGLGLATSYGVIERFGGRLTLGSAPGEGTTATVTLPLAVSGDESDDGAQSIAAQGTPGGTVLVVEDAEGVRHLVVRILARAGWDVLAVASAPEALALLAREGTRVQAVVTDVALRGMSGTDLLTHLRAVRPGLPVVLMSGYTQEALGSDLGAPLLTKPFSAEDLLRALQEARSGSRSPGSSR